MASSVHPELELRVIIDSERFAGDADAELERRFEAAVPTLVERARSGSHRCDTLSFHVEETDVSDAADALWRGAVITWLADVFDEVSDLVDRENKARKNIGRPELAFSRAEVSFGEEPVVSVALEDGRIPVETAGIVGRARDLMHDRAFGEDVVCVNVPGCAVGESAADERAACVPDFRMWDVNYADGTQVRYDSLLAEAVPQRF